MTDGMNAITKDELITRKEDHLRSPTLNYWKNAGQTRVRDGRSTTSSRRPC